ncbi:11948_t:CDS:2 [Ambispora leptoticha]|uniref:11948_t:CDS:1 n=1 Tax=Ambispora leptoticha TaxID=144679 RepID=A0A9N9N2N9_9GLOM|nr:11948_t:CDS:2 [Ambispora leptoticha]
MNNKDDAYNCEPKFRPCNIKSLIKFSEDGYESETLYPNNEMNKSDQGFPKNYNNLIEQESENLEDNKFETKLRPWNYKNLANKEVKLARPILTKVGTRKPTGELVLTDLSNIDYNDPIEGWRYAYVSNHNPRKEIMMSIACHPYQGKIVRIDGCTLANKPVDLEKLAKFEEFLNEEFMNAVVTDVFLEVNREDIC